MLVYIIGEPKKTKTKQKCQGEKKVITKLWRYAEGRREENTNYKEESERRRRRKEKKGKKRKRHPRPTKSELVHVEAQKKQTNRQTTEGAIQTHDLSLKGKGEGGRGEEREDRESIQSPFAKQKRKEKREEKRKGEKRKKN